MNAEIIRIDNFQGTFGVLLLDMELFCWTLERPYLDNLPNVSCIPTGDYFCERYASHNFGETFLVMNVPGRTYILFHPANYVEDLQGCIALGKGVGYIGQMRAIKESKLAMGAFMKKMVGIDKFKLRIRSI